MINPSDLSEQEILTLTLIGEARGEPVEGQIAVGCVIRNRVFGSNKTYSGVCLSPLQFSCWNRDDVNRPMLLDTAELLLTGSKLQELMHIQCEWIAKGIIQGRIIDNTHGAMNYLTSELFNSPKKPLWAKNVQGFITKGKQVFFTA